MSIRSHLYKKDIGPGEVARSAEQGAKSDDLSLRAGYA
jgi:hypothetical protein